ncbi:MAG: ComEC/Rec2 family competence protein [Candidatus Nealsonbacteria bacterium]
MTKSKILLFFCLSFIGGIFLNSFIFISQIYFLGLLILGLFLIPFLLFFKRKGLMIIVFCLVFFGLGIWRHQVFSLKVENNELKDYIGKEKVVTLTGIVDSQPSLGEKTTKLRFQPQNITGKVLITKWRYPKYKYGDKVKITGILEEPQVFETFNYKEYLAKDGIYVVMYFPKIELIGEDFSSPVMKIIFSLKDKLKESVNKTIPSPQAGLLEALLFGDEENIPEHWKEKFNLTGTRHIAAVSGMNITIISSLILGFLLFLGLWRNQAFYLSIVLILFYVLSIGAPASAIRAAIMSILFLTAQHFGRVSSGQRTIVFSATVMLFFNPLLLKSDIGFQLSFLAILGLIYLQSVFLGFFKKIPNFFQLRYSLASTFSAQFFTLPVLIYNFGQIPLIGPLSNIFIIPLLPLITILGFIIAFLGGFFTLLAKAISFLVWPLLTYILKVVEFSSKIPYASLTFKNVSFVWLLISYLILGFITWRLQERRKLKFLQ